jgi:hypothetical protein
VFEDYKRSTGIATGDFYLSSKKTREVKTTNGANKGYGGTPNKACTYNKRSTGIVTEKAEQACV